MKQQKISRRSILTAGALITASRLSGRAQASVEQGDVSGRLSAVGRPLRAYEFDLADVRIGPGPFMDNQQRDMKYLLAFDPDRLLAPFEKVAGFKPKAMNYGGWENSGLASHITGHFLSSASMMYAHTRDKRLLAKIDALLPRLAACQKANGRSDPQFRGYCAGMPGSKAAFKRVLAGHINVGNPHAAFSFGLDGMWSPWYCIHKIMAGLRDAYLYTGRNQAKTILLGMTDWARQFGDKFTTQQMQLMLISEQGGMNEVLADVYSITGRKADLELAEKFNQKVQLDPLMHDRDILAGHHSNQYIPRVIGIARQYELTGKQKYRAGSEFFWQNVARHRTYAFGGNSDREYFFPLGDAWRHLSVGTAESCCTYNILKLTNHYFCWNADMESADFFERGLLNHILGSQDPETGMMTYYMSMQAGHFKTFSTPWDSFWCCVGTGMENHSKYARGIYYHNADTLWVNLYVGSTLNWKAKGITLTQTTRFPEENNVRITVSCAAPSPALIKLRHPYWSTPAMEVTLNGKALDAGKPGSYLNIQRTWANGDTLEIRLQTPLRLEPLPHHPEKTAILAGPVVLAGVLGDALMKKPIPYANGNQYEWANVPDPVTVPVLVPRNQPVEAWLKPDPVKPLVWHTTGVGKPEEVTLVPFYKVAHERYVVYFDQMTPAGWSKLEKQRQRRTAEEQKLNAITVDHLDTGSDASLAAHQLRDQVQVARGTLITSTLSRGWIAGNDGGGFTFTMKCLPDKPQALMCAWWGSDGGARTFEIDVDDRKIATQSLHDLNPGHIKHIRYSIPESITRGKTHLTIHLQANPGNIAGGLFGARIVTR